MEVTKEKTTFWTKDFILLMVVTFFASTAITTQMGTLPLYVASLGGSNTVSGVIVGILGVSALMFRMPIGQLLDRYGRKVILGIGLFILLLDFGLLNLWSSLGILFVLRFVQGIGNGTQSTAVGALASDLIPRQKLSVGLGYFSIAQTLPSAIGPVIGLAIIENWGFENLFRVGLVFVAIAFALSFLIADPYKKKKLSTAKTVKEKTSYKNLLKIEVVVPSLMMFLICLANAGVTAFLAQYAIEKGISGAGYYFTIMSIATVSVRLIFPKLIQMIREDRLIIISILAIIGTFFLVAVSNSMLQLIIAAILYGIGFASLLPVMNTIVLQSVNDDERGSATAIFTSALDVAYGGGAMLWGVIATVFGFFTMYALCGGMAIISCLLFLLFKNRLRT